MTLQMLQHQAAEPRGYTGHDRRAQQAAIGSSFSFYATAAIALLTIIVFAMLVGDGRVDVSNPDRLAVGFAGGAVAIAVSTGVVSVGRFAASKERGALDVGLLMLVLGLGWLLPLRLASALTGTWTPAYGVVSLGAAFSILGLVVSTAVLPEISASLGIGRRLIVVVLPMFLAPLVVLGLGVDFSPDAFRMVAIPVMTLAGIPALAVGILRHNWLLGFVGLELLGAQVAEVMGKFAAEESLWFVSASMVAIAATMMGLYGVVIDLRQSFIGNQARLSTTWTALQKSQKEAAIARQQTQGRMHSLRSGLLGVEAVVSTIGLAEHPGEIGEVVAVEVARLRELTTGGRLQISEFDLAASLRQLTEVHLRGGTAITLDAPTSLIVRAAEAETIDAVNSLIHNAIRHAPGAPITISAAFNSGAAAALLEIRIRDRGPGVPEKMTEKVFRHGFTTHDDGTGLGLPVARMIARAQGGDLTFRSRLGGGAEFVLELPIEPVGPESMFA